MRFKLLPPALIALPIVAGIATALLAGAVTHLAFAASEGSVSSDRIRDRVLSRIERGRMLRAPPISGGRTAAGGGAGYESVLVGGQVRLFVRYTPNKVLVSGKPAPVVFVLHPDGMRADQVPGLTGLNRLADAEGFIAVYPQAGSEAWLSRASGDPDDVDFLNRLADALVAQTTADSGRLYLAGVGASGTMALRLACSEGSRFAAYGLVGMPSAAAGEYSDCRLSPARLSVISGTTADVAGASSTGASGAEGPISDPIAAIAQKAGCGLVTQATLSGKVARSKWSGCSPGADFEMVRSIEKLPPDRAMPELWAFFRRFGL